MSGLTGRTAAIDGGDERQLWAVHADRHQGRIGAIRYECEMKAANKKSGLHSRYDMHLLRHDVAAFSAELVGHLQSPDGNRSPRFQQSGDPRNNTCSKQKREKGETSV
jgi:hypothetical protein